MYTPTDTHLIQAIRNIRSNHYDKTNTVAAVRSAVQVEHADWVVSKKVCLRANSSYVTLLSPRVSAYPIYGR